MSKSEVLCAVLERWSFLSVAFRELLLKLVKKLFFKLKNLFCDIKCNHLVKTKWIKNSKAIKNYGDNYFVTKGSQ